MKWVQRTRPMVLAVIAAAMLLCGCASDGPDQLVEEFVVSGIAFAGPMCPVEKDPPDPTCADRPVVGAVIRVTEASDDGTPGDEFGDVITDGSGRFTVRLPAGTYTFTPEPVDGILGTAAPVVVIVPPGASDLLIAYDTGIR